MFSVPTTTTFEVLTTNFVGASTDTAFSFIAIAV
jgi:hypothetical protein